MYARVGLTSGEIVVSDIVPDREMQALINETGGLLGSGEYIDVRVEDVDDAIAFITALWSRVMGDSGSKISVLVDGENITYRGSQVAWFRIMKES